MRAARALGGEVEAVRGAVDLERRPGRGGRLEHRVPVEVEVVAGLDHPARRVRDDVDVRAADRVERAPGQLGARLAAGDVDGRDDEVEPREEVVLVVELAVGADLELAAVEEPEAARVGALRRSSPRASSSANRALSAAMISRSCSTRSGRQAARDREALRVVGEHLVRVAEPAGGLGHDLDRVDAVAPVGVRVQVAAEVGPGDEARQPALVARPRSRPGPRAARARCTAGRGSAYAPGLVLERAELGRVALERLAVLVDPEVALLAQLPAAVPRDARAAGCCGRRTP